MGKIRYNDEFSYEIFDDGYDIFTNDDLQNAYLTQRDPYGKIFDPNGSYEDNAKIQMDQMSQPPEPGPLPPTPEEKLRSDVDYLALMLDISLPSEEEEGE